MSKEIVLPDNTVIYPTEENSGAQLWKPAIPYHALNALESEAAFGSWRLHAGVSAVFTTVGAVSAQPFLLFDAGMDPLQSWSLALGVLSGIYGVFAGTAMGLKRKAVKMMKKAYLLNGESFQVWVYRRYGLSVNASPFGKLSYMLAVQWKPEYKLPFKDVHGRKFFLKATVENEFYVIDSNEADVSTAFVNDYKEVEAPALVVKEVPFEGESATLFESLKRRLEKAQTLKLNVDRTHVVNRVREDLNQTIQVHERIVQLDSSKTDNSNVRDVLAALNDELFHLLEDEINDLQHELKVQADYVKSRRAVPSDSSLVILPPVSTSTVSSELSVKAEV